MPIDYVDTFNIVRCIPYDLREHNIELLAKKQNVSYFGDFLK